MAEALPSRYDPQSTEADMYARWEAEGCFRAGADAGRPPFVILMPPPNVTGELHVGHALFVTLQDVLIRWRRMQGYDALWIPGTDHAGIATQMMVERDLQRSEGKSRHDVGRDDFLRRVWAWRERYGDRIADQIRRIGASPDWERQFFTMDDARSHAVREAFVRLHEDGLIYRANRLINWCPKDRTALSDLEVEHRETEGELWSFAYALSDGSGEIVVATTRPETMLGDTAIAVHPEDERYRHLIGRTVRHPILDREIPIVADGILVDPEFGTGAVKVTPAHDFNDFAVGERHGLAVINLLNPDGTLNEAAGPFAGLDRLDARAPVKAHIAELGLDRGSEPHVLSIGTSQRSGAVVEPYLSVQWFVRAKPLAEPAIRAVERGDTVFMPENWTKTYMRWMHDIHDWCISRQLWWGHRIPAWYGPDGHAFVARSEPEARSAARDHYGEEVALEQDPDVLDTWFSSGLLPFSALGWPEETEDLRRYYPGTVMETGHDIIFFWVARMMMLGLYFRGEVPFRTVFLHAMVRDEKGDKMSKTKGNVIDPLSVVEEYGADALRFTLASVAGQGRNINLSMERVAGNRAFANKLWNVARLTLMYVGDGERVALGDVEANLDPMDRWILSRLTRTATEATEALERFRFQDAAETVYAFVWGELADWYLEMAKPRLRGDLGDETRAAAAATLVEVLDASLRLLHPMMPFVTEAVWQRLPRTDGDAASLMISAWPEPMAARQDAATEEAVAELQEVIGSIRTLRSEYGVEPGVFVPVHIARSSHRLRTVLGDFSRALADLAKVDGISFDPAEGAGATAVLLSGAELTIPLSGVVDLERERERLSGELERLNGLRRGAEGKLSNEQFVTRAPDEVVAREREKLESFREQSATLRDKLSVLR